MHIQVFRNIIILYLISTPMTTTLQHHNSTFLFLELNLRAIILTNDKLFLLVQLITLDNVYNHVMFLFIALFFLAQTLSR